MSQAHASRAIIRCEDRPVSHVAMVVLAVMATWADPKAGEPVCFKEQASIARRAKISDRAVRNALTELERAGMIKRLGIVGGHATKRGTIRWGLILLWDTPLSVPQTDKGEINSTSVPQTDKGSVPQRCIHELLIDQCALCRPRPAPVSTVDPFDVPDERGPWFEAAWENTCSECGRETLPGDEIRADGHGGYLCGGCGACQA